MTQGCFVKRSLKKGKADWTGDWTGDVDTWGLDPGAFSWGSCSRWATVGVSEYLSMLWSPYSQ